MLPGEPCRGRRVCPESQPRVHARVGLLSPHTNLTSKHDLVFKGTEEVKKTFDKVNIL